MGYTQRFIICRTTKTLAYAKRVGQPDGYWQLKFKRELTDAPRVHRLGAALKYDIPYMLEETQNENNF